MKKLVAVVGIAGGSKSTALNFFKTFGGVGVFDSSRVFYPEVLRRWVELGREGQTAFCNEHEMDKEFIGREYPADALYDPENYALKEAFRPFQNHVMQVQIGPENPNFVADYFLREVRDYDRVVCVGAAIENVNRFLELQELGELSLRVLYLDATARVGGNANQMVREQNIMDWARQFCAEHQTICKVVDANGSIESVKSGLRAKRTFFTRFFAGK